MPPGAAIAGIGGLAVGCSYAHLRAALPGAPWTVPALLGLLVAVSGSGVSGAVDRARAIALLREA